ncbi:MAG: DNA polymerase III subunit gamma/tau [Clostridiales bacterium]|jgi:DNA polymerase-3 subunit gamma/tau|nr:DNA polymerase III subunit gamma/tau [Clostridiales bacterium]
MYQVLYRKWRPRVFADVVGQPHITVTLKNELQAGRVSHAYLFTGSRGTGKTTCAKILAKAVNCLQSTDGDPCGECVNCVGIDNGSILDVVEIDAASNNGVENIRNLREEASFTPASAKYRVYIIDEVHMLSIGAFNALLKTLEEPPAHVVFILATTEVHKLPATILSRCQRFDFHRIAPEDIASRLHFVAEQEGANLEHDAALLIARIADGAMRDALSLLDQCIGRDKQVTMEVVSDTAGIAGREHLFELSDAIRDQDSSRALAVIDRLHRQSKDMVRLCEELIGHFRNLMLLKTMKNPQELIVLSKEEYQRISDISGEFSLSEVVHALDTLQSAMERMFKGTNRRTELELCLLKLCAPELDDTVDSLIRRISQLERQVRQGIADTDKAAQPVIQRAQESPTASQEKQEARLQDEAERVLPQASNRKQKEATEAPPSTGSRSVNLEELQKNAVVLDCWPEVLQVLKGYSQVIASAFHGSLAYTSGDFVLIDAPNDMAFELLRKSVQRDKMRIAIKEVTGRVYKLGPYQSTVDKQIQKDPLDELVGIAEDAGIKITKN